MVEMGVGQLVPARRCWAWTELGELPFTRIAHIMAQKPFAVGGIGAQPSLDDLVRVAQGQIVALDPSGAERIKKLSPPPKQFLAEAADAAAATATEGSALDVVQSRAIVTAKLLVMMNGRSGVRVQLCDYLAQLLNLGLVPTLHAADSDSAVLKQLADACHGVGSTRSGGELAASLAAAACTAPGLSAVERAVVESGASASAGVSALTVQAAKRLVTLATAVAALSVEAVGAQVGGPCGHCHALTEVGKAMW